MGWGWHRHGNGDRDGMEMARMEQGWAQGWEGGQGWGRVGTGMRTGKGKGQGWGQEWDRDGDGSVNGTDLVTRTGTGTLMGTLTGTGTGTGSHLELEGGFDAGAGVLPGQLHGVGELVLGVRGPAAEEGDAGGMAQPPPLRVGIEDVFQHWGQRDGAMPGSPSPHRGPIPSVGDTQPPQDPPSPSTRPHSPRGGL